MNEELKPCPFCGSKVELNIIPHDSWSSFQVYCETCDDSFHTTEDKNKTIKLWNTRPVEDYLNQINLEMNKNDSKKKNTE